MPAANIQALENLLCRYLKVGTHERAIFIHDPHFRNVAMDLESVASRLQLQIRSHEILYDGIKPLDERTAGILTGEEFSVILFGVVHNIWHTPERKSAKRDLGKRLASFVCSPDEIGNAGSMVSVNEISAVARQLFPYFPTGAEVRITTHHGSDFSAIVGTPFCEHGDYTLPGTGGDFPAGEVGFGPKEGSVSGQIVYDVKVQHIGLLDRPLRLMVQDDRVLAVSGRTAERFEAICNERGDILRYISEISLGVNPQVGVSAAPAFIPEEKTFGTLHCGHGGNASYGNRRGPHIDGVMANPTVTVNGRVIMQDGILTPGTIKESPPNG